MQHYELAISYLVKIQLEIASYVEISIKGHHTTEKHKVVLACDNTLFFLLWKGAVASIFIRLIQTFNATPF